MGVPGSVRATSDSCVSLLYFYLWAGPLIMYGRAVLLSAGVDLGSGARMAKVLIWRYVQQQMLLSESHFQPGIRAPHIFWELSRPHPFHNPTWSKWAWPCLARSFSKGNAITIHDLVAKPMVIQQPMLQSN